MPMNIHTFPAPPRQSGSKLNGHTATNGHTEEGGQAVNGHKALGHVRQRSFDSEDMECEDSDEEDESRVFVHVEVRKKTGVYVSDHMIRHNVRSFIQETFSSIEIGSALEGWEEISILGDSIERIFVADVSSKSLWIGVDECELHIHTYTPTTNTRLEEFSTTTDDDDDENDKVPAASVRELPSPELEGLWENLIYSDKIKERLLHYIHSTTSFSDAEVDFNVVSWNRMVLLHGPPGTGKTSLCRALAQKLSIRLSDRYSTGRIVEINSHSLFSKWFSESGKLVQKLFSAVHEMVDDEDCFVVVMIDEVESLTAARAAAMSGNEPSDAVRVVNALLTQLDKLKVRKNVLVMTTSNIAGAIDPAFVDRADIKEYVGLPPPQAIYWILGSCLQQLMQGGLVKQTTMASWSEAEIAGARRTAAARGVDTSVRLLQLAQKCHQYALAGRFLRRLPVLAHARYIAPSLPPGEVGRRSLRKWLEAMDNVVEDEKRSRGDIELADGHKRPVEGMGSAVKVKADGHEA